ncbi:tapasin-related protein-like isoform 1-T1 [Aulostomus maculatus]
MDFLIKIFFYLCLYSGVQGVHQMSWLPCKFIDENVSINKNGEIGETQLIHRDSMLQFGQKGDAPVNPHAITFLVTGSKLDLRRYVESSDAEHLECEIRKYKTEGIHVRWPVQEAQEYNRWFICTLKHTKGLFTVMGSLRNPSDQPPSGDKDYRSWFVIGDREILTTAVTMVVQTQSPLVITGLGSQHKLHCQFAVDHKKPNINVDWHHRGERRKLYSYSSHSGQIEGTGVGLKSLVGGDASYSIPSTKMSHGGTYVCSVSINPLLISLDINLHIQETPRVSLNVGPILSLQEGDEQKVVCEAEGYYPLDVEIDWYEKDPAVSDQRVGAPLPKRLQNVLLSSHKHNTDKTFSLAAFFYFRALPRHSGKQFICSVSHKSLRVPIKKSFIVAIEEPSSWLFILLVGATIVILLISLYVMLRYLLSVRRHSEHAKPY